MPKKPSNKGLDALVCSVLPVVHDRFYNIIGVVSKTHSVVVALKRQGSKLASYQQKVFKIDDHIGIAICGLTSDARVLARYIQDECLNHKYVFDAPMQTGRLVTQVWPYLVCLC